MHTSKFLRMVGVVLAVALLSVIFMSFAHAQSACPNPYTVEVGDTWLKLFSKCGVWSNEIKNANPGMGDVLVPGDVLIIPGVPVSTPTPTVTASPTNTPTPTATPTKTPTPRPTATPTPRPIAGSGQTGGRPSNQGNFIAAYRPDIVIDGDFNDWNLRPWTRFDTVVHQNNGTGRLSATFDVGWNLDGLLIGVSVEDSIQRASASASKNWMNDSIELLIDTDLYWDFATPTPNDDDFQFVVDIKGRAYRYYPESWKGDVQIPSAFQLAPEYYYGEILIPWNQLGISPRNVGIGMTFGFSLAVTDNDLDYPIQQRMISTSSARKVQNNPTQWGMLTLGDYNTELSVATAPQVVQGGGWNSCLTTRLQKGVTAQIVYNPPYPNTVYSQPTSNSVIVDSLVSGEQATMLDGPVCADGKVWWWVQYSKGANLKRGWTSEGVIGQYWMEPIDAPGGAWLDSNPYVGAMVFCEHKDLNLDKNDCHQGLTVFTGNIQQIYTTWTVIGIPAGSTTYRRYTVWGQDGTTRTWNSAPSTNSSRIDHEDMKQFFDAQKGPRKSDYGNGTYMKPGTYQVELILNGLVVQSGIFTIE